MANIVYAAGNHSNSLIQLERFLKAIEYQGHKIKIAAYKKSSPSVNIDWTLDALLNPLNPSKHMLDSDNFQFFYSQVVSFKPDLIISDLEHFSSYIANQINCTLWQYSSSYIYSALTDKYKTNIGIKSYYGPSITNAELQADTIQNLIINSDRNLLCSHLGDTGNVDIVDNFEWVRPYHCIGKKSKTCEHNVVAALLDSSKPVFDLLNKQTDCITFTKKQYESYTNVTIKDFCNQEEYYCNLKNCKLFMCRGQTTFLADAYYNDKFTCTLIDYDDQECITNALISQANKLSKIISHICPTLNGYPDNINFKVDDNIRYIDEEIKSFFEDDI